MRKILLSMFVLTPSILFAQTWVCNLTSYGAISGFTSRSTGQTWVPKEMAISVKDQEVTYSVHSEIAQDSSPKIAGNAISAKDEIGFSNKSVNLLLKTKLEFDRSTGVAKLSASTSKGGYKIVRFSGNYQCNAG